ncbi:MAG: molybdopterin molybdotransferase MoeA [Candidatus Bathyarchaeota archaeon]|nr:MAG: molybdopterin molybdotransferase MoeA [Candidatus Bathyarchaeota archaeon]
MRRTFEYSAPAEALSRVIEIIRPQRLNSEAVKVEKAFGQVLAEDVLAGINIPEYDSSRFDGFAVRAEDTVEASKDNPISFKVKDEVRLGKMVDIELGQGEACKIPTGGFLPSKADAVVMAERVTSPRKGIIRIHHPLGPHENVIAKGEDAKKGDKILFKGRILRAQDVGLLAALGIERVHVFRKPRIPIISTGNELVENVKEKKVGEVLQSHGYMISRLVERMGCIPIDLGIVPDDISFLRDRIVEGLREGDLLMTIGGCSVGDRDYVPDAIQDAGEDVSIIQGVKRRPGRVSGVGIVDGKPIVMLPGHIQSAFVGFHLFAIPLIRRISGTSEKELCFTIKAKVSKEVLFKRSEEFENAVFVKLDRELEGWTAKPIVGDSSLLKTLVEADGFTIVPSGKKMLTEGEEVDVNLVAGFSWV